MTVDGTNNRTDYDPDGIATVYTYDFRVDNADDLVVYADGIVYVNPYTVTGLGEATGGDVTFDAAPISTIEVLTLIREVPITQQTSYPPLGPFPARSHEQALDKLTFIAQQQQELLDRAMLAGIDADPTTDYTLPPYVAGEFWYWDTLTKSLTTARIPAITDTNGIGSVRTIAELRERPGKYPSELLGIGGYYTPGDEGGAGLFYWDPTSALADNGGTVIKVTAVLAGRWIRIIEGDIYASFFGFAEEQSATTNTAALKAAIEYVGSLGGPNKLNVTAGNFKINEIDFSTMTVTSGFILQGAGWAYLGGGVFQGTKFIIDTVSTYSFNTTGTSYLHFRDFAIDADGKADLLWINSNYSTLYNIKSTSHLKYGCKVSGLQVSLENCSIDADLSDGTGAACLVEWNANRLLNSSFNGGGLVPSVIFQEKPLSQTYSGSMRGCTLESGAPYELQLFGEIHNITIDDNYFEGNLVTGGTVYVDSGLKVALAITNNKLSADIGKSIYLDELNTASSIEIRSNLFGRAIVMNLPNYLTDTGLNIDNIPQCEITNNYCNKPDRSIILNNQYNIDYLFCEKTTQEVLGSWSNRTVKLGSVFLTTVGIDPDSLIVLNVPNTGGTTYANGVRVTSKVRWREDASTGSRDINYYQDTALAWNDAVDLDLLQQSIVSLEGDISPSVTWNAFSAPVGIINLVCTGKDAATNIWFGDFEISSYQ